MVDDKFADIYDFLVRNSDDKSLGWFTLEWIQEEMRLLASQYRVRSDMNFEANAILEVLNPEVPAHKFFTELVQITG